MVKVFWHETASPLQADGSVVLPGWRQYALPCGHIGAIWWIWLKLFFLWPTRVHNPNSKSIGSAVSAQLTAESPCTLQWATLSPKIAPSHWGSDSWFLGPVQAHNPNGIMIRSAVFAQVTADSLYFTVRCPLPLKIASFCGGIWTPFNTWFPGPNRVLNSNGILIGSGVFAGLTSVTDWTTDRPTDHATRSVTIDCICVQMYGWCRLTLFGEKINNNYLTKK